ncbi:MAG TPA: antibiotic biosynthesis monooxygenase, partial [SAR202 cluster bacterium]|nr:antibiotic biosynthesis monooxygenase [SAR202 cluster bacterium]
DTRNYEGCEYISLSFDQDDENTFVMTEQWVSREHHRIYSEFRENDGTAEIIAPLLIAEPTFRYLNLTDA